ncbi:hypothetical protein GOODEAATRI_003617, partial [Goodea atripinnis]
SVDSQLALLPDAAVLEDEVCDGQNWRDTVSPELLATLSSKEVERQAVIYELFTTEVSHLRTLRVLDKVFYRKMRSVLNSEELACIFPNLPQVYELHAGNEFQEQASQLCCQQTQALELIKNKKRKDPRFAQIIQVSTLTKSLKDLLVSEMQRLTKYPLLLDKIIKYTEEIQALLLSDCLVLLQKGPDDRLQLRYPSRWLGGGGGVSVDNKTTFSPLVKLDSLLVRSVATVETLRNLILPDVEEDRWSHDTDDTPTNTMSNRNTKRQQQKSLETLLHLCINELEPEQPEAPPPEGRQPSVKVVRKGNMFYLVLPSEQGESATDDLPDPPTPTASHFPQPLEEVASAQTQPEEEAADCCPEFSQSETETMQMEVDEIEKAHHKLLESLRDPSFSQESEDQPCCSAAVSRTPSMDRSSGDGLSFALRKETIITRTQAPLNSLNHCGKLSFIEATGRLFVNITKAMFYETLLLCLLLKKQVGFIFCFHGVEGSVQIYTAAQIM